MQVSRELAEQHYDVHRERPLLLLVEFITLTSCGDGVGRGRCRCGSQENDWCYKLLLAEPGTIRVILVSILTHIIHGSDAIETANREIDLVCKKELVSNQALLPGYANN